MKSIRRTSQSGNDHFDTERHRRIATYYQTVVLPADVKIATLASCFSHRPNQQSNTDNQSSSNQVDKAISHDVLGS